MVKTTGSWVINSCKPIIQFMTTKSGESASYSQRTHSAKSQALMTVHLDCWRPFRKRPRRLLQLKIQYQPSRRKRRYQRKLLRLHKTRPWLRKMKKLQNKQKMLHPTAKLKSQQKINKKWRNPRNLPNPKPQQRKKQIQRKRKWKQKKPKLLLSLESTTIFLKTSLEN